MFQVHGNWAVSLCTLARGTSEKQSPKAGILKSDVLAGHDYGANGEQKYARIAVVANGVRVRLT
jgi:hypothetical protein